MANLARLVDDAGDAVRRTIRSRGDLGNVTHSVGMGDSGPPTGRLDQLIARLGALPTATPRVHAGVTFDPANGLGGSYDPANVDYRGFMAYMRPSEFLQVNPPRDMGNGSIDHILRAVEQGEPIGTPILYVDGTPGGEWRVRGHEGRGRMHAMKERSPDSYFPVAVHPLGWVRSRHLSPEDALSWLRPDDGGTLPTRPALSIIHQKPYVQPSVAENYAEYGTRQLVDLLEELSR